MTETRIDRRSWLAGSAASVLLASRCSRAICAHAPDPKRIEFHKPERLRKLLYPRDDLDGWLAGTGLSVFEVRLVQELLSTSGKSGA